MQKTDVELGRLLKALKDGLAADPGALDEAAVAVVRDAHKVGCGKLRPGGARVGGCLEGSDLWALVAMVCWEVRRQQPISWLAQPNV
jgi:hypothetical protein